VGTVVLYQTKIAQDVLCAANQDESEDNKKVKIFND